MVNSISAKMTDIFHENSNVQSSIAKEANKEKQMRNFLSKGSDSVVDYNFTLSNSGSIHQ